MLKLIKNEYTKIFLKKTTYVIIIICLLLAVGISALVQYENDYSDDYYYEENSFSEELEHYKNSKAFSDRLASEMFTVYIELGYEYYSQVPQWLMMANYEYIYNHYYYVLLSESDERETIENETGISLEDMDLEYEKKVTQSMKAALKTGEHKTWCQTYLDHLEYLKKNNLVYAESDYEYYKYVLERDIDPEKDQNMLNALEIYMDAKVNYDMLLASREMGENVSDYELETQKKISTIYKYIVDNRIDTYKTEELGLDEYYFIEENKFIKSLTTNSMVATMAGIFVMIVAAGIVANEFSNGTIKFLLINPVKRAKIFWSKYITCITLLLGTLIAFFAVHFVFCVIICGTDGLGGVYISYSDGIAQEQSIILYSLKQYALSGVSLITSVTLAFAISSMMKSNAVAIAISIIVELAGTTITLFLHELGHDWARYFIFANTDLASISNGAGLFPGQTLGFALGAIAIYMIIYLFTAYDGFTKREV